LVNRIPFRGLADLWCTKISFVANGVAYFIWLHGLPIDGVVYDP